MNRVAFLKHAALAGLVLAGSAAVAPAAGLLSESYYAASFDYVDFDEPMLRGGKGASFVLNSPLNENVDLGAHYSYLYTRDRSSRDKLDAHEVFFDAAYIFAREGAKPYVKGGIGWSRVDLAGPHASEWLYALEAGVEIPILGNAATITPLIRRVDGFRSRVEHTYEYGLAAQADLSSSVGLLSRVMRDDDANWGYSAGVYFRF